MAGLFLFGSLFSFPARNAAGKVFGMRAGGARPDAGAGRSRVRGVILPVWRTSGKWRRRSAHRGVRSEAEVPGRRSNKARTPRRILFAWEPTEPGSSARFARSRPLDVPTAARTTPASPGPWNDSCLVRPAWGAEVVSSNIVGYNKVDVTANSFDILGSQFTNIGETDIDLQDLITEGLTESDNILFFNGTGYDSYTFFDVTFDENWNELGAGWQDDASGFRAEKTIAPGEAFWIKPVATKTMTFAGETSITNTYTFVGGNANKLVSIPVPEKIDLQDVTFQNIAESDSIQIYNGAGYDSYTYFEVTFDENWNELGAGWQDDSTGFRSTKKVDLGKGFWIKAANNSVTIGL